MIDSVYFMSLQFYDLSSELRSQSIQGNRFYHEVLGSLLDHHKEFFWCQILNE